MTSTWLLRIHCDGNKTTDCHGLLELPGSAPATAPASRGWHRAYRDGGHSSETIDLCPSCWKLLQAEIKPEEAA